MTIQNVSLKILIFTLAMFLSSSLTYAQAAPEKPKMKVQVAKAVMSEMAPSLDVPGTIVSLHNSRLAAETSATVDWVAEVGAYVKKGDPVAKLNQRLIQLDLVNSEADINIMKARLDYRTKEINRLAKLLGNQSIPQTRYDEVFSQKAVLENELQQAYVRRDRIKYLKDKTIIRSPVSGWVVERFISVGEYVQVGAQAVRLVDTENTEISVQAPLSILPNIKIGMEVTVSSGDQVFQTQVRAIIPVGDNISRMVEIRVENPENIWMVGTPVRVSLPNAIAKNVLTVPRDALIIRAGQSYIYKITQDGKAERVNVRSEMTSATNVAIIGRLSEGDRVVTRGGETLQSGQDVEILPMS